jgi:hypothetical protein
MDTCCDNALRLSLGLRRETLGVVQRLHLRVSFLAPLPAAGTLRPLACQNAAGPPPCVSRDDAMTRTGS